MKEEGGRERERDREGMTPREIIFRVVQRKRDTSLPLLANHKKTWKLLCITPSIRNRTLIFNLVIVSETPVSLLNHIPKVLTEDLYDSLRSLFFTTFISISMLKSTVPKYWFVHSVILRAVLAFEALSPPSLRMRPSGSGREGDRLIRQKLTIIEWRAWGTPQKLMWTIVEGLAKENTLQEACGHISTKNEK